MSAATRFNRLAQKIVPKTAARSFPDLMNITSPTPSAGGGGGQIKGTTANIYENIPVAIENTGRRIERKTTAGKMVSVVLYKFTFPTHQEEERIEIDISTQRLVVLARGNKPEKTYRIERVINEVDVIYEVEAYEES